MLLNDAQLRRIRRCLQAGGVIGYPTEAVWGLGCDPASALAVKRVLRLKRRSAAKGMILIAADFAQIWRYIGSLSPEQRQQIRRFWPGPVTLLLPAAARLSPLVRGQHSQVAIRLTRHPIVRQLCRHLQHPLISTSANRAGAVPARSAEAVRRALGCPLQSLVPGQTQGLNRPTPILDLKTGQWLRR